MLIPQMVEGKPSIPVDVLNCMVRDIKNISTVKKDMHGKRMNSKKWKLRRYGFYCNNGMRYKNL